ncbi:MAG: hypothetical protein GC162_10820 [Planctomycetes bacterium]|nr:hypothetical protein [Planctomycetota bacterium]
MASRAALPLIILFACLFAAGCATSVIVNKPYAQVVQTVRRMYPSQAFQGAIAGPGNPLMDEFLALASPPAGTVAPAITGSPRFVRHKEPNTGAQWVVNIIDYRGAPASIDTDIVIDAVDTSDTRIRITARDYNTPFGLFGGSIRDASYERARLDEIQRELDSATLVP